MFRDGLLAGKRVLITGGGTGLGKSMGRRFLELGAELAICSRRAEVLEASAEEHRAATGGAVSTHSCDVDAVDALVEKLFAARPLDGFVNNPAGNVVCKSQELSPRALDAVLGIVLKGSASCTLACGRCWLARGAPGTVLSIAATYAWTGSAYVLPSAMAQAGVVAMTQSLAVELDGRGIRLNAIAPGPFPTPGAWERLVPKPELAARPPRPPRGARGPRGLSARRRLGLRQRRGRDDRPRRLAAGCRHLQLPSGHAERGLAGAQAGQGALRPPARIARAARPARLNGTPPAPISSWPRGLAAPAGFGYKLARDPRCARSSTG